MALDFTKVGQASSLLPMAIGGGLGAVGTELLQRQMHPWAEALGLGPSPWMTYGMGGLAGMGVGDALAQGYRRAGGIEGLRNLLRGIR